MASGLLGGRGGILLPVQVMKLLRWAEPAAPVHRLQLQSGHTPASSRRTICREPVSDRPEVFILFIFSLTLKLRELLLVMMLYPRRNLHVTSSDRNETMIPDSISHSEGRKSRHSIHSLFRFDVNTKEDCHWVTDPTQGVIKYQLEDV